MTPDECIKNGQQIVRENKLDVQVEGSEKAEETMFEGTNRTAKRMHIICAGLSTHNVHSTTALVPVTITANVCYVRHNKTLTNYLEMDGDLKNPSEKTKELLKTIYTRSCSFNKKSDKLVSLKVVQQSEECYFRELTLTALSRAVYEMTNVAVYIVIPLAGLGIVGNIVALSVHLSTRCDKKQSVHFVVKGLSEVLLLVCIILQASFIFMDNPSPTADILVYYLHPNLYHFSLFCRNWVTVIIGIEKCLAVWAPFFAMAHFNRCLEIKLSLITVGIAGIFTAGDFLTKYFISDLIDLVDIDILFIGGKIKMALFSVIIHSLLPWVIVLICSVVAVSGVKSFRKKRAELSNRRAEEGNDQAENSDLVKPVLLCLLAFIISGIPVVMYMVVITIGSTLEKAIFSDNASVIMGMVSVLSNIIGFSMDFYVSLAAREDFREQLYAMKNLCMRQ